MAQKSFALWAVTALALTAHVQPLFAQGVPLGSVAGATGLGALGGGMTAAGISSAAQAAGIVTTIIGEEGESEAGETMSGGSTAGTTGGTSSTN